MGLKTATHSLQTTKTFLPSSALFLPYKSINLLNNNLMQPLPLEPQLAPEQKIESAPKTIIADNYGLLSRIVADLVSEQLKDKPASSFGMPVGRSVVGTYEILARRSSRGQLDWQQAKCFALDDYLSVEEPYYFQSLLVSELYQYTNIERGTCFNPRFQDNYDELIAKHGGLDCCILGIGSNGHIAFNEPGTPQQSWTHCVWLSESTRLANKDYFASTKTVPTQAITMGIATILASRKIILVATGLGKKEVLKQALTGPATPAIPASFLTLHPHVITVTDFHLEI